MNRRVLALAMAVLAAACAAGPDRSETLAEITDDAVVPAFAAAASAAADLDAAVAAWCRDHGDLAEARSAWRAAVAAWHRTEPAWAGPVAMERTDALIDYPVTVTDAIDELVAGRGVDEPVDAARDLASTQRGLGAVEYLLFRPEADTDPIVCDLLAALTGSIADAAAAVRGWWADDWLGAGPYADRLAGRGDGAMTSNDALGDLVAGIVESLKRTTLGELGPATGITTLEPDPDELGEGAAGAAAATMAARLEGIAAVYSSGLGSLVAARSPEVDAAIVEDIDDALRRLRAVTGPLVGQVTADPAAATELYDDLSELRRLFEADVVSLLDVTVGFSDTDGDTG